jgi:hypothetical protein
LILIFGTNLRSGAHVVEMRVEEVHVGQPAPDGGLYQFEAAPRANPATFEGPACERGVFGCGRGFERHVQTLFHDMEPGWKGVSDNQNWPLRKVRDKSRSEFFSSPFFLMGRGVIDLSTQWYLVLR